MNIKVATIRTYKLTSLSAVAIVTVNYYIHLNVGKPHTCRKPSTIASSFILSHILSIPGCHISLPTSQRLQC